jgi:hypothetical protein
VPATGGSKKLVFYDSLYIIRSNTGMFTEPGDSGAHVVAVDAQNNRQAVGMVIASYVQRGIAFALSLPPILAQFGLAIVSGHNV